MVSPIRDAAIDGMVEAMLAPAPKIQLTIKKKVDICKAASFFGGCLNTFVQAKNFSVIMYTTQRPFVQKVKTNFVTTPGIKNSRELTPSG